MCLGITTTYCPNSPVFSVMFIKNVRDQDHRFNNKLWTCFVKSDTHMKEKICVKMYNCSLLTFESRPMPFKQIICITPFWKQWGFIASHMSVSLSVGRSVGSSSGFRLIRLKTILCLGEPYLPHPKQNIPDSSFLF